MELSPIPGMRGLPPARAPQGDLQPPAIFDVESSAKPGDGREQRNGRKAAGAEENEEDELLLEIKTEAPAEPSEELPPKQVDYFA